MSAFVLAHGSWWGGWSWGRVAARLHDAGRLAYAPSYTGTGDRAHLLGPTITIETFVEDCDKPARSVIIQCRGRRGRPTDPRFSTKFLIGELTVSRLLFWGARCVGYALALCPAGAMVPA
jgi:hypothetical protein